MGPYYVVWVLTFSKGSGLWAPPIAFQWVHEDSAFGAHARGPPTLDKGPDNYQCHVQVYLNSPLKAQALIVRKKNSQFMETAIWDHN